jgi:hypothetical protein
MKKLKTSNLGRDKLIRNFRHFKKLLIKQHGSNANPSHINLFRRKHLTEHSLSGSSEITMVGFQSIAYEHSNFKDIVYRPYFTHKDMPNWIDSYHPGDCLLYGNRENSNYFTKD